MVIMELRTGPEARLSQRVDNRVEKMICGLAMKSRSGCRKGCFKNKTSTLRDSKYDRLTSAGYRDTITT